MACHACVSVCVQDHVLSSPACAFPNRSVHGFIHCTFMHPSHQSPSTAYPDSRKFCEYSVVCACSAMTHLIGEVRSDALQLLDILVSRAMYEHARSTYTHAHACMQCMAYLHKQPAACSYMGTHKGMQACRLDWTHSAQLHGF